MKKIFNCSVLFVLFLQFSTHAYSQIPKSDGDRNFGLFETHFLDAYWKQYTSQSIFIGYGKYYENLQIPNKKCFENNSNFSKAWLDSLKKISPSILKDNNKISFNIIKNQLESDYWYLNTFKIQEWDPSGYNLSGECYYLITQPFAPLDERLKILSKRLQHSDEYYAAALQTIKKPTKEHTEMAIQQLEGGLEVFGKSLSDSIDISYLTPAEKENLRQNVAKNILAMTNFSASLKKILADKNYIFRDFRIGQTLYNQKYKYDLGTIFSPKELFEKAESEKNRLHKEMFELASQLWAKYEGNAPMSTNHLFVIKSVIDKVSLHHASPSNFIPTLTKQVHELKKYVVEKNLFAFDTTASIIVRVMPAYESGFASASAEFSPPYQKQGNTYYNIEDYTKFPPEKAESALREVNDYLSQILTIHEAVPGHCMQGIYNNKNSGDILRSVLQNGAMIEGWAVYCERMMMENGWGDNSLEMHLVFDKWLLREAVNVLVDYEVQCLNAPKEKITQMLKNECFQSDIQVEEKYHRASVSQVQLCSYFAGSTEILALREAYKMKMGRNYSLKDFHEKFLSYGSAPVKYIREQMLK